MGKAYANRKKEIDRPEADFYQNILTFILYCCIMFDKNQ